MDRSLNFRNHQHFLSACWWGSFAICTAIPVQDLLGGDRSGASENSVVAEQKDAGKPEPSEVTTSQATSESQESAKRPVIRVSFSGGDPKIETLVQPAEAPTLQPAKRDIMPHQPFGDGTEPVRLAQRKSKSGEFISGIANAEQLVQGRVTKVVSSRSTIEVEMPQAFDLTEEQQLILVDRAGNMQSGSISVVQGKRIRIVFDEAMVLSCTKGEPIRFGLLSL